MEIKLNKWEQDLTHWCPAQMYYYFLDSNGGKWCIYLRADFVDTADRHLLRVGDNSACYELVRKYDTASAVFYIN